LTTHHAVEERITPCSSRGYNNILDTAAIKTSLLTMSRKKLGAGEGMKTSTTTDKIENLILNNHNL
jgi:hypothetical protein